MFTFCLQQSLEENLYVWLHVGMLDCIMFESAFLGF